MLITTKINALKPRDKAYKVGDAHGLYVYVRTSGTRCWRQKYRYNGKEKVLNHGTYPTVSLAGARELRDATLKQLRVTIQAR